jgi:4-hydroxythreonine-4-phosphate dehydrogenase
MGDPAGVGPEIILKALSQEEGYLRQSVVFGNAAVLEHYNDVQGYGRKLRRISAPEEFDPQALNVFDPCPFPFDSFKVGEVSPVCGDAAFQYVVNAIEWAKKKDIAAVVTAPLNKEALHLGGHNYDGHTEIFNEFAGTGTGKYAMLLWSEKLKVIHVTTHVALKEACGRIKKQRVVDVIHLAQSTLLKTGYAKPRIAVAGLNPHSGENGIFGHEEIDEIRPAIEQCASEGIAVEGPVAPDTVFLKASQGKYDIVAAMYHDQGHIPIKLLAFDSGVNITVGLPIIRTSVDHGTAFDIAGKGIADPKSLLIAIQVAGLLQ